MDFEKNVHKIEAAIGYTFRDRSLLRQAFTRSSYCNEHRGRRGTELQSNEVLEFIGDSVLGASIITLLMRENAERYEYGIKTKLDEGDFSNIKSGLSDKKNLSRSMAKLHLSDYLLVGEGDAKLGIKDEPSVMEDLFESIIGAIFLDSGEDLSRVLVSVSKMLSVKEYVSSEAKAPIQSFKNALQEWCADKAHRRPAPIYKTESESGPDHKKVFTRACYIGDKIYGTGTGKNQKIADALAAEAALARLTEEEHIRLNELCKATGLTMSKLIRFLLSGYLPAQAPPAEYSVLIKELRAVGNNLNQLARIVHSGGYLNTAELDKACKNFNEVSQKVDEAFAPKRAWQ